MTPLSLGYEEIQNAVEGGTAPSTVRGNIVLPGESTVAEVGGTK